MALKYCRVIKHLCELSKEQLEEFRILLAKQTFLNASFISDMSFIYDGFEGKTQIVLRVQQKEFNYAIMFCDKLSDNDCIIYFAYHNHKTYSLVKIQYDSFIRIVKRHLIKWNESTNEVLDYYFPRMLPFLQMRINAEETSTLYISNQWSEVWEYVR